jgi:sugar lactone lactonase YvrE
MDNRYWLLVIAALCISACGGESPPPEPSADAPPDSPAPETAPPESSTAALPARIILDAPGLLTEGIEYDAARKRFLVGSLSQGTVFEVAADGSFTPVVEDDELVSSVGIEVDAERDRLIVANADRAVFQGESSGQAKVGIYELSSGDRIAMVDLAAVGPKDAKANFANDIAVGDDGTVYVTDSFARVVYEVDADHTASVLMPDRFGDAEIFLNGIVHHPDGYLLVAEGNAGGIYKVPLDDPGAFTEVTLPEPLPGADGMVWHPDGRLIVVRNDASRQIAALRSDDEWISATAAGVATVDVSATTAAIADDAVYVVHPYFDDPAAMPFIERVEIR